MAPVAALSVEELSKAFGGLRAVENVALTVTPGERRALIGPRGRKTTLLT
jgi:branched-chain amino acid transport system ATP-binding protein